MEESKHDFKWFGEGFDGFPKSLPEDCVEYTIYVIDTKLSEFETRKKLREVQTAASNLTKDLVKEFIWQRESFQLSLEREEGGNFLRGRTNYGDSVEDEWLIVYILRELSKQFPQAWVRAVDTDGQFLLIEAANVLPLWLNPEIADFRVWMNEGRLLIIPVKLPGGKASKKGSELDTLTLCEALNYIEDSPSKLLHLPKIEAEAFYRLQKYPQQISDSLHYALLSIPRKLAYVLHESPAYISAAVEAFYLRDPIALRPLQVRSTSKLAFAPVDFVTTSVKFTKVGYAQLKSQQFDAPASWTGFPSAHGDCKTKERAEMGMKIACGFEMLLSDHQNRDKIAVRVIKIILEEFDAGAASLPSDTDVRDWGMREDDESWLDINFEDFEKELGGSSRRKPSGVNDGFGDKGAQDNLRKIVARFENFLNDDTAGADGAEFMDDMDIDDADDTDSVSTPSEDSDDAGDDKDLSFDEDEFTKMMREMMGMPADAMKEMMKGSKKLDYDTDSKSTLKNSAVGEEDLEAKARSKEEPNEEEHGVCEAMYEIERELRDAGALDLDPKENPVELPLRRKAINTNLDHSNAQNTDQIHADADDEVDVDVNLVKNMLESFKSQGGASGPGGNLLSMMGMRMPRDEREHD